MVSLLKRLSALVVVAFLSAVPALAQSASPSLQSFQTADGPTLIRSCTIVTGKTEILFEIVAESDKGLSSIEIGTADRIVGHKECKGAYLCKLNGGIYLSALKSDVLSVQAVSRDAKIQTEKMRLNLKDGGEKIYMIVAMPSAPAGAPLSAPIASLEPSVGIATFTYDPNATGSIPIGTVITAPPAKGPDLSVNVTPAGEDQFDLSILSQDATGVDFIEILENGSFLDVQVCANVPACAFNKTLRKRPKGSNRYLIKTMNKDGAVSYQEKTLEFK